MDTSFLKLYAETRGFMLGRPQKPKVTPDGKAVLFLRADPTTPRLKLYEFDVATQQTKELLSSDTLLKGADENLTPEEKARRERQRVSVGGIADYHLNPAGTHVLVKLSNVLYVFDRTAGKVRELKTGKDGAVVDPKWSPDGKLIGYVHGFDVYAYDLEKDAETAVTTGGTATRTHGLAEFVAQEEMGRHSGFWWSPDSKFLAYTEADHTGVETWWIADPLKPDQKPQEQFYPRPGRKNVAVRLGVKPVSGGETVWVKWDRERFEYLAAVHWDKTGPLVVQLQDRKQQSLSVQRVDPATGAVEPLWAEKDAAWVNLSPNVPRRTAHGFVWVGRGPDGPEVQLRDGDHVTAAVPASARPLEVLGYFETPQRGEGPPDEHVVYTAAPDPTQQQVRVHTLEALFSTPQAEAWGRLTAEPGMHTAAVGSRGHHAVTSTTLRQMPRTRVFDPDRTARGELPSVAGEPPFTPNVVVEKVGDYWTAVVRPRDFDPKKKYPVIVDVYGGPRHLHVVQAMRNWLVPQWLADQGFIVVAVDNRGTPGRGREWEAAVYQKFGTVPLDDQAKGLKALCDKHPELDAERVGIVGWSFGGYMAANGVLRMPGVFKAAVAGAPVTDWEDYDTHYTERYMGLLPEARTAYDEASLIPLAKVLRRPLLLVHGTADDNVYYRHTLKLSDALFRAGKEFEALALPGVTHMYTADPAVMERLWARTAGFFRTHLGGPK